MTAWTGNPVLDNCRKAIEALGLMKAAFVGNCHLQTVIDRHIRGLGKNLRKAMTKGGGQD
jgi:hypothetical protein